MLPDSISEEKLRIEWKMEDLQAMPLPDCPIRPCFVIQTIMRNHIYSQLLFLLVTGHNTIFMSCHPINNA